MTTIKAGYRRRPPFLWRPEVSEIKVGQIRLYHARAWTVQSHAACLPLETIRSHRPRPSAGHRVLKLSASFHVPSIYHSFVSCESLNQPLLHYTLPSH